MFTRIQTRSFRCLKAVDQTLGRFNALVGPNASGKTTFLDVIALLGDISRNRGDVYDAIQSRSETFQNLLWKNEGRSFQLAVEAEIPVAIREMLSDEKRKFSHVRYEVEIGTDDADEIGLNHETLWLFAPEAEHNRQLRLVFPQSRMEHLSSILMSSGKNRKAVITKKPGGNDNFYTEGKKKTYAPSFKLGRKKSALANLPADVDSFPVSTWFRDFLDVGVQTFTLNSQSIRQPSPPGKGRQFKADGSNLPWVIAELRKKYKPVFKNWLAHVRTALEDIADIDTVERPDNKHRHVVVKYANGAVVPSWMVSDGTLRLLALTITAYLPALEGTFLIEEPENGIHPRAIDTVLQSLSSLYHGQVLIATHSPVALTMLEPKQVLCFAKDAEGATDIVSGEDHPALRDWKNGEPDFGILFASGILS